MDEMDEKFIKNLLSNVKCGRCGQHCEPTNAELLGYDENLWVFSVYCPSCESQGLVAATIKRGEVSDIVTELTEAKTGNLSTPISSDDVLDMHIFLKDFSGDFSSLLRNK